jgi:hypothetical protein
MRARHEVATLVAGLVLALDGRCPGDRRRRHDEDLAPREGARARFGQRDRIAFALDVQRIAIHLVEEQIAHRHRAQADRAVGPGHHQHAAPELLGQDRVARVAAARRRDQFASAATPRSADRSAAWSCAWPSPPSATPPSSARARGGSRSRSSSIPSRSRPSCAAFMNTTRSTGEVGDRQSMMAFRYGVRLVRQRPGSEEALLDSIRCRSDHSDTVSSGSGVSPFAPRAFDLGSAFVIFLSINPPGAQFAQFLRCSRTPPPGRRASCGDRRELGCHLRRDARRPVEPGIALGPCAPA